MPRENDRFILHDSIGFEHGESREFTIAKEFLESRSGDSVPLKERVHVIWLCVKIPYATNSSTLLFEEGDKALLKLAARNSVPTVVVFTQFDVLVASFLQHPDTTWDSASRQAETAFQTLCPEPFRQICKELQVPAQYQRMSGLAGENPDSKALAQLIEKSQSVGDMNLEGAVYLMYTMAQRANIEGKLKASLEVGMNQYWQYVVASAEVINWTLDKCLNALHQEIVTSWNIHDPKQLLRGAQFFERIKALVQYVTPEVEKAKSMFADIDSIQRWIGLVVPAAAFAGPASVAVALSGTFVHWIAKVYQNMCVLVPIVVGDCDEISRPETLRCFMAYIVDLTLVLDHAFGMVHLKPTPIALDENMLDIALQEYRDRFMGEVHYEIRCYASQG
ncbi:hypothetical protein B0H13DRAFT_653243, partial [Mycena leptocephala]